MPYQICASSDCTAKQSVQVAGVPVQVLEAVLNGCVGQTASGAPVWGLAEPAGQGRPQSALQAHSFPLIFNSYALQQVNRQILCYISLNGVPMKKVFHNCYRHGHVLNVLLLV